MGCVGSQPQKKPRRRAENKEPKPQAKPQEAKDNSRLVPPDRNNSTKKQGSVSVLRHTNRFTEQQVEEKRKVMKQSLEEGHSKPPMVNYPQLEPISTIDS